MNLACGTITQCGSTHILSGSGWILAILAIGTVCMAWAGLKHWLGIPEHHEPRTDFSPALYDLATGIHHPAYTARVNALTPAGVAVRGRCCHRGHQSPLQAVTHAQAVAARIARTGR